MKRRDLVVPTKLAVDALMLQVTLDVRCLKEDRSRASEWHANHPWPCGGIGRHWGLKIPWRQLRVGSSPTLATMHP